MELYRSHVLVCGGTGCTSSGSISIEDALKTELAKHKLEKEVKMVRTGCFGLCEAGPIVIVYPEGAFYSQVKAEDISRITEEHLLKGRIVTDLLFKEAVVEDQVRSINEIDFYRKQKRVALRNCGVIDPEDITEYIAFDGYKALGKVLTEMTKEELIETIKKSGLRGQIGRAHV